MLCSAIREVDLDQSSVIRLFAFLFSTSDVATSHIRVGRWRCRCRVVGGRPILVPTRNTVRVDVSLQYAPETAARPVPASIRPGTATKEGSMKIRSLMAALTLAVGTLGIATVASAARVVDVEIGVAPPPPGQQTIVMSAARAGGIRLRARSLRLGRPAVRLGRAAVHPQSRRASLAALHAGAARRPVALPRRTLGRRRLTRSTRARMACGGPAWDAAGHATASESSGTTGRGPRRWRTSAPSKGGTRSAIPVPACS